MRRRAKSSSYAVNSSASTSSGTSEMQGPLIHELTAEEAEKRREYHRKYRAEHKARIDKLHAAYRNRNRQEVNKRVAQWKRDHRNDEIRRKDREWKRAHADKGKSYAARYRSKNPDYSKKMNRKYQEELADCYVIRTITQNTELSAEDIPRQLIEAKREQLKLWRKLYAK